MVYGPSSDNLELSSRLGCNATNNINTCHKKYYKTQTTIELSRHTQNLYSNHEQCQMTSSNRPNICLRPGSHQKWRTSPHLARKPWTIAFVVSYQSLSGALLMPLAMYLCTLLTNRSRVVVFVAIADVQICQSDRYGSISIPISNQGCVQEGTDGGRTYQTLCRYVLCPMECQIPLYGIRSISSHKLECKMARRHVRATVWYQAVSGRRNTP